MKIATYNVNGVNGRLPRLIEWLQETQPDVACLQELKTDDTKFPARAIEAAGYGAIWHGQRAHHGVAILAKGEVPKEVRRGMPGDDSDTKARYIEAEIRGLLVASIYLPNGNPVGSPNFDYKLAWFKRLIAHARSLHESRRDIVLAGDLNVVPTDADIYNAWAWRLDAVMQPVTRDLYRRLLSQGWIDAARELHPSARIYTFWPNDNYFRRNAGFRMDFVLPSASLRDSIVATGVDIEHRGRDKPSDHAATWLELSDQPSIKASRGKRT
ncbi:MAG TPA: exodeoxyribonuclease III [Casimicrobiaceae bacterium]|nr:exodeoxyribonuclease III [Casimicrobiaceae bacterium]